MVAGFFGGLFVVRAVDTRIVSIEIDPVPPVGNFQVPVANIPDAPAGEELEFAVVGMLVEPSTEIEGEVDLDEFRNEFADQNGKKSDRLEPTSEVPLGAECL